MGGGIGAKWVLSTLGGGAAPALVLTQPVPPTGVAAGRLSQRWVKPSPWGLSVSSFPRSQLPGKPLPALPQGWDQKVKAARVGAQRSGALLCQEAGLLGGEGGKDSWVAALLG